MIDTVTLIWRFFQVQPPARFLEVTPWHFLAVLGVLGVLSAFGLHFLIGYTLHFYRRGNRHRYWISVPSLLVLLVSVPALLGCYLLALQAAPLVERNLRAPGPGVLAGRLGRALLAPAFELPPLASTDPQAVPKQALMTALDNVLEHEYRDALSQHLAPPAEMGPGGTTPGPTSTDIMVQIALRWAINPQSVLPDPASDTGDGLMASGEGFYLAAFLKRLVDEVQPGVVLTRADWEHVAGTNFQEQVLRPVMGEYVYYLAAALAVAVLLLDALFFLAMWRVRRVGRRKKAAVPAPATAPASPPPMLPPSPETAPPEPQEAHAEPAPSAAAPSGDDSGIPAPGEDVKPPAGEEAEAEQGETEPAGGEAGAKAEPETKDEAPGDRTEPRETAAAPADFEETAPTAEEGREPEERSGTERSGWLRFLKRSARG